jgi:lipoate---protein ligase
MDIASPTPAEKDVERHLAREWQLFQLVESGTAECGSLTWDTSRPIVVLGRSNRASEHVDGDACRQDDVCVVRRASGGGAVVLGPGCLNYAIVLSVVSRPELADVAASFRIILDQIAIALALPGLHIEGMTDLVLEGRKVGGNAQRRGRRALLHHGTLLYDFDPALATRYLKEPVRQPSYRAGRPHHRFLANLPLSKELIETRLEAMWFHAGTGFDGLDVYRTIGTGAGIRF